MPNTRNEQTRLENHTILIARDGTRKIIADSGAPVLKTISVTDPVLQSAQFALSGSDVTLRSDFQDELWLRDIDENQFGQVIDNIIINAHLGNT